MPNIAAVLKVEIARVARKEIRSEVAALNKATTQYRKQIAALRRQVAVLEKALKRQARGASAPTPVAQSEDAAAHRFSAKGLANHRKRLGLSAAGMAKLLGCSPLSVYKWESGKTRPRAKQIEAIAAIRTLGRKEAQARMVASEQPGKSPRSKRA